MKHEHRQRGLSWALEQEKRNSTGQEKSLKGYISPICGETAIEVIYIKNCAVGVGD